MYSLFEQPLLFVDCQTTGATPASAHLLEIGWAIGRACDQAPPEIFTRLIALPEDEILPARIQKITGITDEDMASAGPAKLVAEALQKQLEQHDLKYACAHWAQFEKTFLTDCFVKNTENKNLALDFICTCQIAKKLYPDLPSRAIRAVGGYFGLSLDEMKRAHGHVETTYFIWQKLVQELDQLGIKNAAELLEWLSKKAAIKASGKNKAEGGEASKFLLPLERLTRLELPDQPGVYRMLNSKGKILYVGKATSLKSRVNSYFTGRRGKDSKTKELISQVFDLNVSPLATPLEAALLENDLIKEHDPPYNRALKKRGRSLVYFNSDFSSAATTADHQHVIGPFPRGSTIEPLVLLVQGLKTKSLDAGLFWGLLDQETSERAVALFFSQYQIQQVISVRSLLALGLSFYRRDLLDTLSIENPLNLSLSLTYFLGPRPAESADTEETSETSELVEAGEEDDPDEAVELTDDELCQMVRSLITGAARAYVQARTLVRLLDTTISYEEKNRKRKLVFERGYLTRSEDISHSCVAEATAERLFKPAARTSRAAEVDLATYDRMRVLFGEIRRLYGRGHWISLIEADLVIS